MIYMVFTDTGCTLGAQSAGTKTVNNGLVPDSDTITWDPRAITPKTSRSTTFIAPRGALSYPRRSREELEGRFLGPMANPDPKGERDNRMPEKRRSGPGAGTEASAGPV